MAILKNVELFFAKLNPSKPNARFDKENPTWEVQIRTRDKAQAKQWKDMDIRVKPDEDDEGIFYKASLKKKSKKRDGTDQNPVSVVAGDLSPIDVDKIGNGSVANVRVYQYEYNVNGTAGIATMLMAVQVTTLREYEPKPREDDFEMTDMKVVKVAENQDADGDMLGGSDDDDMDF